MNRKGIKLSVLILGLCFALLSCGSTVTENQVGVEKEDVVYSVEESDNTDNTIESVVSAETLVEDVLHEHSFVYIAKDDGTHSIDCQDESCEYIEHESCILDEVYVCTVCGWTHEHDLEYLSGGDATHSVKCRYEVCAYNYQEECKYSH